MTDKTEEALRREVVPEARDYLIRKGGCFYRHNAEGYTTDPAHAGRFTLAEAERHSHPNGPDGPRDGIRYHHVSLFPAALRDHDRPTFEGDEAEVRKWLRVLSELGAGQSTQALALLNAKDDMLKKTEDALDAMSRDYAEALAAKERAEQALADRNVAIVEAVRLLSAVEDTSPDADAIFAAKRRLKPFLPAPEPVSDPLVEAYMEHADSSLTEEEAAGYVAELRQAIARRDGKVVFEGEG